MLRHAMMQELIDYWHKFFHWNVKEKSKLKILRNLLGAAFWYCWKALKWVGVGFNGVDFSIPQLELNSDSIEKTELELKST